MSRRSKVVVGTPAGPDDDLLLPRPPGVFRRFWARHPRFADVLVVLLAFVLSGPTATIRAYGDVSPNAVETWTAISVVIVGAVALILRRRFPRTVFAVALVPTVLLPASLSPTGHVYLAFAAYAIAVYRSSRAGWIALGVASAAIALSTAFGLATRGESAALALSSGVAGVVAVLIGCLIGANVGGRRRYTEALIDRSRQLLVERDQQAQLAAAAERTRIAREMHDIVSHSLTVIVALSEGAAAATSTERARQASRGAADTARDALEEMRAMLGVLRSEGDERSPLEPLEPAEPAHIVDAAQRAGFPVVLETVGAQADLPRTVRFALGRVVQESVTNAMRHAPHATAITVRVQTGSDRVVIETRNDGAPRASVGRSGGFGLRGLRERVEHAGGRLDAGHVDDGSWMLRAEIPLPSNPPEETS